MLLDRSDVKVNATNSEGQTPLLKVVIGWKDEIVKLLLNHPNIAINQADSNGTTPLMEAIGSREMVPLLFERP